MLLKSTGNTASIARRLGCWECLGRLSWMSWESSGISEIARATNVRFSYLWTDDPTGRSVGLIRYDTFSNTIRSDGDYPLEGIPLRLHPTICFGMAIDAINVSRTTYLTVVRYYLANLETTMESQVRSSVSLSFCLPAVSVRTWTSNPLSLPSSFPLRLAVCRAFSGHPSVNPL